jgi:tripartite-type tricarboxylate transporter receptor subunit TctC
MRVLNFICHVALAGMAALATAAHAEYPDKPVKLLVGYPPGGSTDLIARVLGNSLSTTWKQSIVVENKPGASGMIAAEQTVRASADGYTLLMGYTPEVSINKLVYKSMRYDPLTDLTPIALVATAPLVLAAGPKSPIVDYKTLIAQKSSGTQLSYGSPGVGGQQHMAGEMLGKATGLKVLHVPYRGTSFAVTDLMAGQIDLFFATTPPLLQQIKAGKLKPILVAGEKRERLLPDTPTAVELGMPDLKLTNWFGVFGPKGMSSALRDKIAKDVMQALRDETVLKQLEEQGLTPRPLQGTELNAFIADEMTKYKAIVTQTGITAD